MYFTDLFSQTSFSAGSGSENLEVEGVQEESVWGRAGMRSSEAMGHPLLCTNWTVTLTSHFSSWTYFFVIEKKIIL